MSILLPVERDTTCTCIALALEMIYPAYLVERDTPCHAHTAGSGKKQTVTTLVEHYTVLLFYGCDGDCTLHRWSPAMVDRVD
jgi:hypothetical protein